LVFEARLEGDRHALLGCCLLAVRLRGPQRQLIVSRGKPGRDHNELSGLICDRSIKELAVAQQFQGSAWRSRAGDNRVTGSPNECNVDDRHDPIAAARRAGRNGKCGGRSGNAGAFISNARCRWGNRRRGGCGSGFNRLPAPYVRDAEGKRCNTCCNKRQRRHGYPAYRCGSHGARPLAKSLARQHPPKMTLPRFVPVIKGPRTGSGSPSRVQLSCYPLPGGCRFMFSARG